MPYVIQCPSCSTKLKSAQPVPAGRTVTCPQCKNPFTTSEAAQEVNGQPTAPAPSAAEALKPATAAPAPVPTRAPAPPPMPARPGKSVMGALDAFTADKRSQPADSGKIRDAEIVDDEDADDRPKTRRRRDEDGDEDDRPRSRNRGRDDDDDERPRSRRRREEDEDEDERPRGRKRRDDDEEDDRPRTRGGREPKEDEEDEPRPRRGKVEDDEDEGDRPRSKRRKDEEEERPRSKRRQGDEDEDESPRSRKARGDDDEDDEDDRPRGRRSGRKKKKGKKVLLIALLGGGAALLLGAVLVLLLVDPFGLFGGGASSEMLAWVPAEMQTVEGADVEAVSKTGKAATILRDNMTEADKAGLKADDLSSVVIGKRNQGGAAEVTILKLKKSADKDKIVKAVGGQQATANGKQYYKTRDSGGLHFASDKIVVITKLESTMTGLLQKDASKLAISDELKNAVKRADGDLWAASVGSAANIFGGMDKGGGPPGFAAPPPPKSTVMSAKLQGSGDVSMKVELTYADADAAKKAATGIESMMNMVKGFMDMGAALGKGAQDKKMQDMKRMFESLKVSQSGSTVTITMTGPVDALEGMGRGGGMGPF
ncbi:MAG TPA: hypothetical protein VKE40_25910 [Gemmataceae bacterium]|nr:hypothetical protein [Gemmataceae bacterium]